MIKRFWGGAKWTIGGVWAVIIASYIIPWATALVEKRGWIANPDAQVAYALQVLSTLGDFVAQPHVTPWLVGIAAAISGGAVGYWARGRTVPIASSAEPILISVSEPSTLPPSTPTIPLPPAPREYVNITPAYLAGLSNGRTTVQAEKLTAPYVGKWLKVTTKIWDVDNAQKHGFDSVWVSTKDAEDITVNLRFPGNMLGRLEVLPSGHEITVCGRISGLTEWSVKLDQCELLSDRSPEPQSDPDAARSL